MWRNELADTFVEVLAAPWLVRFATGTPLLTAWLRTLGAKIGRGVWLETYWLPEYDLVRLGDGATVNRGCVVQTHLFHDRVMSMDEVTWARAPRSGPHGIVLPGASIGARTTVGPGSLVTRGDAVPADSRWLGNPIATWPATAGRHDPQADAPAHARRRRPTTPYLPEHGNGGYRVCTTTWTSTTGSCRTGSPAGRCITARGRQPLSPVHPRPGRLPGPGRPGGRPPGEVTCTGRTSCTIRPERPIGAGDTFRVEIRYAGKPVPISGRWGDIGWDELTDGVLVASQPNGSPSWFPCNDRPGDKATFRVAVTTASPVHGRW